MTDDLADELNALADSGVSCCLAGGDLVDKGSDRSQVECLASLSRKTRLPVYACLGNHDNIDHGSGRENLLKLVGGFFPKGAFRYDLYLTPAADSKLRFVFLDFPTENAEQLKWLADRLTEDIQTPTLVVAHEHVYHSRKTTSSGYVLPGWGVKKHLLDLLREHPNVVATLNGHAHWDEVNRMDGITVVQNAAICEWPNSYRVFRIYPDRLEWEIRLMSNLGIVRDSFIAEKAVTFPIYSDAADLAGVIPLRRPAAKAGDN